MEFKENRRNQIFATICFVLALLQASRAQTAATELADKLFTNYKSHVRPFCGNNDTITVRLDLALRQIIDMDEPTQILKLSLWVRLMWTDCQLVWNATDYENISSIVVPFKYIWVPDLVLYDSTSDDFAGYDDYRPNINSDGTVYYNFPTIIESICIINVRNFPYDQQVCSLKFGSWSYHGNKLDLIYKNPYGDLASSVENVEWEVTAFKAERHVVYYGCCPEPYPDVTFYLHLDRKPLFYVVNIIIPTFLITAMAVLGFILPPEAGEKIGLEITVMLALAVFQLLVADSLPPSADSTPLIAAYFNFCLFLVGFAGVMAVVVLNIFYKENKQVPRWAITVFFKYISKPLFVTVPEFESSDSSKENQSKTTENSDASKPKQTARKNSVTPEVNGTATMVNEAAQEKQEVCLRTTDEHWRTLALLLDRLACVLFIIGGFIGTVIVFRQFQ